MIPSLRQPFNRDWTPEKYQRFLGLLEAECGGPTQFRHSETPIFLPQDLLEKMSRYGRELVEQLLADPQYQRDSQAAIPEEFRAPNEDPRPLFVQADFGLDQDLEPKLVEIQGFPTLYAYQPLMAACYRKAYDLDAALAQFPGGLDEAGYDALMREAIIGGHDPKNVALLEIDPWHQKTSHDFVLTERRWGVPTVDIAQVRKEGRRLFYERDGKLERIERIYNRAIVDELVRRGIRPGFDFRDELDVEWAGHPNWFFRLSKFSIPYFRHVCVPETRFLDRVDRVDSPERCVLKPLYSFAGSGVIVGPTQRQIDAVPAEQRAGYVLQERIDFRPIIETPHGMTKAEIRVMYVWLDGLRPVNTIIRMGRGAQMGVDHNKGMAWVGGSAAFLL